MARTTANCNWTNIIVSNFIQALQILRSIWQMKSALPQCNCCTENIDRVSLLTALLTDWLFRFQLHRMRHYRWKLQRRSLEMQQNSYFDWKCTALSTKLRHVRLYRLSSTVFGSKKIIRRWRDELLVKRYISISEFKCPILWNGMVTANDKHTTVDVC